MAFGRSLLAMEAVTFGVCLAGCLFPSIDDLTRCPKGCGGSSASASGATTGPGGTGTSSTGSPCGSHPGPAGIQVALGGTYAPYCIDSTEVSVGDYEAFYKPANFPIDPLKIRPECAWKMTTQDAYKPEGTVNGMSNDYIWGKLILGSPDQPVQGLDWCDAAAYCIWAGKRLCGSTDATNRLLTVTPGDGGGTSGEWYHACRGPKDTTYPESNTYTAGDCNDTGVGPPSLSSPFRMYPVNQPATCVAPWPGGLYNMLGNVNEYEDNCVAVDSNPAHAVCYLRGGTYTTTGAYDDCGYVEIKDQVTRSTKSDYSGVRCCW